MTGISAEFDPDTEAIKRDEQMVTGRKALAAILNGQPPPLATPLQRECAEVVELVVAERLRLAKMARLRARVGDLTRHRRRSAGSCI